MKYGLIGEKLSHSFSPEIHGMLGDYEYELTEIAPDSLKEFMESAPFKGINVTIPYKSAVMPYLAWTDGKAKEIGAVNTVVNRGGRLYGYNTDFYGLKALLKRVGANPKGNKTLILGTGGTSKTAMAVVKDMGGEEVYKVSRSGADGAITYEEAVNYHNDCAVIINTTPSGMYPNVDSCPIDLKAFPKLQAVADVVYNPLRTRLVQTATEMGIPAEGGLYMLVAQAVAASQHFFAVSYDDGVVDKIYNRLLRSKENIVLIGMPSSGKSTVGGVLAKKYGKPLADTDRMIEAAVGMKIPDIFAEKGEVFFRDRETEAVKSASVGGGKTIATGGGAVLREENVRALRQNGRLYFLDRPIELLCPTGDRPLTSNTAALEKIYKERYGIYTKAADVRIENDKTPEEAAELIIKELYGE